MASYKVISSRLAEMPEGSIVTDDDLIGLNITALIDGGHLATVATKSKSEDAKDK